MLPSREPVFRISWSPLQLINSIISPKHLRQYLNGWMCVAVPMKLYLQNFLPLYFYSGEALSLDHFFFFSNNSGTVRTEAYNWCKEFETLECLDLNRISLKPILRLREHNEMWDREDGKAYCEELSSSSDKNIAIMNIHQLCPCSYDPPTNTHRGHNTRMGMSWDEKCYHLEWKRDIIRS